jgi:multidrug efflux pump subunit AcrA (membrane-fusion protein)
MLLKNHTFTGAVVVFILMSPGASQGQVAQKERVLVVPATVVPFDKADLFPRETGVLRNVKADMGSRVKKGDVLAEIDNASVVADWEFARSSLEQAKSNVKLEEGKVHRFQSMVQSARSVVLTKKAGLGGAVRWRDCPPELWPERLCPSR